MDRPRDAGARRTHALEKKAKDRAKKCKKVRMEAKITTSTRVIDTGGSSAMGQNNPLCAKEETA